MSKISTEGDGGPFPPRPGRPASSADMHAADIQNGIADRQLERKRRAGMAAFLGAAGESLSDQINKVRKAIHSTR